MKQISYILLLLFSCGMFFPVLHAQEEQLHADLEVYVQSTLDMDFAGIVEFTPPELLEFMGGDKAKVIEAMEGMLINETMETSFSECSMAEDEIVLVSDAENHYALIPSRSVGAMRFLGKDALETAKSALSIFEMQMGEKNVDLDEKTATITMVIEKDMYGILKPDYDHWVFVEAGDGTLIMLPDLIPPHVVEQLEAPTQE